MRLAGMSRGLLIAACAAGMPVHAQNLPATAPTVPAAVGPATAQTVPAKVMAPPHKPRVEYAGHVLEVSADNSSLNAILREVARVTGMKITGGVTEERVYGTYGPGTASMVLDRLLEGTGVNSLLILNSRAQPAELVLTQRNGSPSPPNPSVSRAGVGDEDADLPPQLAQHRPAPGGNLPPPVAPSQAPAQLPVQQAEPATAAPTTGTTTQQSPNGVKTPQEIYEQLMKLQQQKQQTTPQ